MNYTDYECVPVVVINHAGEQARLVCNSESEAARVRESLIACGNMGYDVTIEYQPWTSKRVNNG